MENAEPVPIVPGETPEIEQERSGSSVVEIPAEVAGIHRLIIKTIAAMPGLSTQSRAQTVLAALPPVVITKWLPGGLTELETWVREREH